MREERSYIELQKGGGYFSKFEWQPEPYGLYLEEQSTERLKKDEAQERLHGKDPFYSHPQRDIKHRH